jgi:predicted RNase H-like HicB family nuclease
MKSIKVIIERAKDGSFSAYGEKTDGIWGMGDTAQKAKESAIKCLKLFIAYNDPSILPKELKGEYKLVFKFDTQSLLNYYKKVFTNSALERMTGINQKQLQHYSTGLKKPRPAQVKKIETALHQLGNELLSVQL